MMTGLSQRATIGICTLTVLVALKYFLRRKAGPLPPGPKKRPLIGSLLNMPTSREPETFLEWSKEYGSDVVHIGGLGMSIIVLNSYEAAEDLLNKRSSIYSSRPHIPMFHDLSGWGFQMTLLPYGPRWKASRRLFTQYFAPSNYDASHAREVFYTNRFLRQLLEQPEQPIPHIRHLIGGIAVSMAYGIDTKTKDDPYIALIEHAMDTVHEMMVPGTFYVDILPFLKYLPEWTPGAAFHQKAKTMRECATKVREETFTASLKLIEEGSSKRSFVSENLKNLEESGKLDDEGRNLIIDVANIVYMAAADTTASALGTFFLAMTCHPEIQKRAQAEVDGVVQDRLPTHDDLPKLPYLAAVIKETLRWFTVVPLGVPHFLTADDTYKGYHIPAETLVLINQWAMSNDENVYPRPREFIPERYLCNGKVDPTVRDPTDIAFGFGRRACPGKHLALSTLTLAAASVLSTFDILKQRDEAGVEIEPKKEYTNFSVNQPLPFPCLIKPRSTAAVELIRSTASEDAST